MDELLQRRYVSSAKGVADVEACEWDSLAADAAHASTVVALYTHLLAVIKASLANPTATVFSRKY